MLHASRALAGLTTIVICLGSVPALRAAGPGQSLLKGAARSVARRAAARLEAAWARDLAKDAARRAVPLARPRTVFRYATGGEARRLQRAGLAAGTHMTSKGGPGRPMNAPTANAALGLKRTPSTRVTLRLPKGHPVKVGKVQGGAPGRGEILPAKPVPSSAVRRVLPLRK